LDETLVTITSILDELRRERRRNNTVATLIESLRRLIEQSSEVLGPEDPSTLMLKQQLAAELAKEEKSPKVFWMQAVAPGTATHDKKG
jgi:hypothetical protein